MDSLFWFLFFLIFVWMLAKTLEEQLLSLSTMLNVVQHKFLGLGSMFETANTASSIVNKLKTWHFGFWRFFFFYTRDMYIVVYLRTTPFLGHFGILKQDPLCLHFPEVKKRNQIEAWCEWVRNSKLHFSCWDQKLRYSCSDAQLHTEE